MGIARKETSPVNCCLPESTICCGMKIVILQHLEIYIDPVATDADFYYRDDKL
jgi:hypothetical protein